jgi:hypothetical protein
MSEKMTKQQVFDKVKAHLLTQGRRAQQDGECRYRAEGGLMCAAGCLIKDKYYSGPLMEGFSVTVLSVRGALISSGVPDESIGLVGDLQDIHDNCPVEDWWLLLGQTALNHGLSAGEMA